MPGGNKNIKPSDNPKPFKKGVVQNPNGAPKKIYTIIKEHGYSGEDVKTAFGELSWYTLNELKDVHKDNTKPIIVRIVANQLFLALSKGDMSKIKEILEYTLTKPVVKSEVVTEQKHTVLNIDPLADDKTNDSPKEDIEP